jgi:hypothetical protein
MYTGLHAPLAISGLDQVSGTDTDYAVTKYAYDVSPTRFHHRPLNLTVGPLFWTAAC